MKNFSFSKIAEIRSDFPSKFGIPRQSGLVPQLRAEIVFEPEYRVPEALRGIEGYSHLWLIWQFSEAVREDGAWSPTVRPPRLGGNRRMGVFATRSPYRPNPIGLSSVRLEGVRTDAALGPVLIVSGADLLNGTPILDIKPYLPFTDCHPDAAGGFADKKKSYALRVEFPETLSDLLPPDCAAAVTALLEGDPRPSYQDDPERVYGMEYGDFEVCFTVSDGCARVTEVRKRSR